LLCAVPTLMIMWRPFKNLILARTTQIGLSIFSFLALMYLLMSQHGYAVSFTGGLTNGKDLVLIEKHYEGDGDGGSYESYRMYVLDLKTGERTFRSNIENPSLLCMTDSSVFFYDYGGKAVEYSLLDFSVIDEVGIESGFEEYPELKTGIASMNSSSRSAEFINEGWLTISANDGHHYCYNLLTEELLEREYAPGNDGWGYTMSDYSLSYRDPLDQRDWSFSFETKTGDIEQLVFHAKDYSKTEYSGEFLDPEFVAYNPAQRLFVVKHYETLERKKAIFSAISYELKPVWKLEQNQIIEKDNFTENPEPGISFCYKTNLIVTFGGAAACLNILTGEVIWKAVL